jgi:hypothetical protein
MNCPADSKQPDRQIANLCDNLLLQGEACSIVQHPPGNASIFVIQ